MTCESQERNNSYKLWISPFITLQHYTINITARQFVQQQRDAWAVLSVLMNIQISESRSVRVLHSS